MKSRIHHLLFAGALLIGATAVSFGQATITPANGIGGGGTWNITQLLAPDGCTTIPYSFTGRATTGVCSSAANTVDLYANNALVANANTSGLRLNNDLLFINDNTDDIGASGARPRSIYVGTNGTFGGTVAADVLQAGSTSYVKFAGSNELFSISDGVLGLRNHANDGFSRLVFGGTGAGFGALARDAAGIKVIAADGTTGAFLSGVEQTAPSAPASNGYRIFAQDNGAGKTQLMVIFGSGAAQQIAIEP